MEEEVYKALRAKQFFTTQDINSLIVLCDRLFHRNNEISLELSKALEIIHQLDKRVEFYRSTTMKRV